jgi:hypothetical protein
MSRPKLKEFLVPLCAGLMHPEVWSFCKYSGNGIMRLADTRQRAFYLMMRFVKLMHLMWALRCQYVHGVPDDSPAGQHRDAFFRSQRLGALKLNDPDKYEAFLAGDKWVPVVVTQAKPSKRYDVRVLDQVGSTWLDIFQGDIREKRKTLTSLPTSEDNVGGTTDELCDTTSHELVAAEAVTTSDDMVDIPLTKLETCPNCEKDGRPGLQCADCVGMHCTGTAIPIPNMG